MKKLTTLIFGTLLSFNAMASECHSYSDAVQYFVSSIESYECVDSQNPENAICVVYTEPKSSDSSSSSRISVEGTINGEEISMRDNELFSASDSRLSITRGIARRETTVRVNKANETLNIKIKSYKFRTLLNRTLSCTSNKLQFQ